MPETELVDTAQPIRDYGRLTQADITQLIYLDRAGRTQVEIAQELGCSQPTVSKWLTIVKDPLEEARHILRQGAPKLAATVVNTKHAPTALETLRDLQVSEKRAPDAGKGAGVTVLVGAEDTSVQVNLQVNIGKP